MFAVLYSALFVVFLMFISKRMASYGIAVEALLLVLLLINRTPDTGEEAYLDISYGMIAGVIYIIWLLLHLLGNFRYTQYVICLLCDAVMVYLYFAGSFIYAQGRWAGIIYAALFVLNISAINREYPFIFFVFLMIAIICIPIREDPINWDPVVDTGRKVVARTREMASTFSYYLSEIGRGSAYHTGYSSLAATGDALALSDRTEIEIITNDNPTITYTDEESGKKIKRRKTIYLTGGKGVEAARLLDILFSFYTHEVDGKKAYLFSYMSDMDISYVYLKTKDEIMPEYTVLARDNKGVIGSGRAKAGHKKGYRIKSRYMELDTGSPYLAGIIANPVSHIGKRDISYKKMSSYAFDLYGIRLKEIISEDDYAAWQEDEGRYEEYLDTRGISSRMYELSDEITKGCESDYERCKAVESYLRQYRYSTELTGGEGGNTGDTSGMGKLAEDLLFNRGAGYCVHFSSAMVILLRLEGIPARLVSGYRYVFPFDKQDSYEVSGSLAHVWPEAYIKGFGWVPFEPTPAMASAEESTWHRHPALADMKEEGYYVDPSVFSHKEAVPLPPPNIEEEAVIEGEDDGKTEKIKEAIRLFMIVFFAAAFTVAAIILTGLLIKRIRYLRSSPEKRLIMDVKDIRSIVGGRAGDGFYDRGVLSDYDPYIPDKYRTDVLMVFSVYYRIMYRCKGSLSGTGTVSRNEELMARELRKEMRNEYRYFVRRKNKGKIS